MRRLLFAFAIIPFALMTTGPIAPQAVAEEKGKENKIYEMRVYYAIPASSTPSTLASAITP